MAKPAITKDKLIILIRDVYETDVGDFKRKAALYLNRFAEGQSDQNIKKQVEELKNFIIYKEASSKSPMKEINSLRFSLLDRLEEL